MSKYDRRGRKKKESGKDEKPLKKLSPEAAAAFLREEIPSTGETIAYEDLRSIQETKRDRGFE